MSSKLNPRTTSYEFLGPPGALAVSFGVPIVTYVLHFGCSEVAGGCPPQLTSLNERIVESVTNIDWWKGLWDTEATLIYLAWYIFCVVAWAIIPGDQVEGTTLRTGEKKRYKINGTTLNLNFYCIFIITYLPQHSQLFSLLWVLFPVLFYVSDQSLLLSFITNGLASSLRPWSWQYFKQLTVLSLHSVREPSWLWVAILEIYSTM